MLEPKKGVTPTQKRDGPFADVIMFLDEYAR